MACCPVAALGGVFVGVLSLARIRRSSGVLRGQPTAWIGIALSAFVGVSSMLVADRLQSAQSANSLADIRCAVEQTLGGREDASAWWVSDARAGLADFQREASVLLAPAKVAAATQTGTLVGSPPVARFRLVIQTQSGEAIASVEALLITDWSTWLAGPRLRSIEIALPRGHAMEAPTESGEPAASVRYPSVDP